MASTPSKSLLNWLQHHSGPLNVLLSRVGLLRRITAAVRDALPASVANHCLAANIDGDTLVVGCDSSAWAAKLRYHIPQLLERLKARTDLPALSQIRVRVQPLHEERARTEYRRFYMSEHSAALITSIADNTADPELKAALHRLSKHAQPVKKS